MVDAITITGKHVDPYSIASTRGSRMPTSGGISGLPERLANNHFFVDYNHSLPFRGRTTDPWVNGSNDTTNGREIQTIASFHIKCMSSRTPRPRSAKPRQRTWRRDCCSNERFLQDEPPIEPHG